MASERVVDTAGRRCAGIQGEAQLRVSASVDDAHGDDEGDDSAFGDGARFATEAGGGDEGRVGAFEGGGSAVPWVAGIQW